MQRTIPFLAPLGLAVALGAWIVQQLRPLPGGLGPWLAAGLALVVVHLLMRWEDVARALGSRQTKYGASSVLFSLAFLGILGLGNFLVQKHTKRWDLTKTQRYSLQEPTLKLLAGLKDDVSILYFQTKDGLGDGRNALGDARDQMRAWELASPHIRVEYINPLVDAQKQREYDIKLVPTLILKRGARTERISGSSEQDLANAILKVTREGQKTVCFLEGEGEVNPDEGDPRGRGLSEGKKALEALQYKTKKFMLLRDNQVPADCSAVVVAAPQADLPVPAVDGLRQYVTAGGKLLVLLEPEFKDPQPNLRALLAEWNLIAGQDLVLDLFAARKFADRAGPETLVTSVSGSEEATRDLIAFHPVFHTARSIEAGTEGKPGIEARKLVWVDETAWKQLDFSDQALRSLQSASLRSQLTTVNVAALATIKAPSPAPTPTPTAVPGSTPLPDTETKTPEGRVIAMGDADFATNALYAMPGNSDLFENSVAWLAQDSDLISIRPKEQQEEGRLIIPDGQMLLLILFALAGLPGLFVVLGIATWWRRRS